MPLRILNWHCLSSSQIIMMFSYIRCQDATYASRRVISKIRKIDSKFKVCFLSAFGSEEYKARFSSTTSANGIYYMRKPISVGELVAKVNEVIAEGA